MSLQKTFRRDGFVHLRAVFSQDQIATLRESADRVTSKPGNHPGDCNADPRFGTCRSDIYARFPEFQWVLFHEPLLKPVRDLTGSPVVFIPEHPLHKNFYSNWHRDTSAPRRDRQRFYFDPNFRIVQVAIYLQDNSPQWGGGLDIVPGSHHEVAQEWLEDLGLKAAESVWLPFNRGRGPLKELCTFPARIPALLRRGTTIPIQAGDVVIFDLRLRHRATPRGATDDPRRIDKYALFLVCSSNNHVADEYLHYIRDVRKYESVLVHQFPTELKTKAEERGVVLL